ncbi:MFS general substrate transporter [Trametes polyzona]|nr:MFS general substrate transporter [Trametes polyzona]
MILADRYSRDKRRGGQADEDSAALGLHGGRPSVEAAQQHRDNDSTTYARARADTSSGKWRLLLIVALFIPALLETLDYTVVATAQVEIASIFDHLDIQSCIGAVYLLTSTAFLPLFASLADVWGRHWALQASLLLFAIGSAISTGAHNMATVLAGRGISGMGAAGMMAVFRIIVADSNSLDGNSWPQSVLFFLFIVGLCIGPVIGGVLTAVSFRWVFAINLPCVAVAMILCFFILRGRTKGPQSRQGYLPGTTPARETFLQKMLRVDWIGAFLFIAAGILLLLALNWGSAAEWNSARVIASFVVSGVVYIAWAVWEVMLERNSQSSPAGTSASRSVLRTEPMIPFSLFLSRDLCIVQFATFVNGMVMLVMFYFLAIFFAIVQDRSGTDIGTQLVFFGPGLGLGAIISIVLLKYTRQLKWPIVAGGILTAIGVGLISSGMDLDDGAWVVGFMTMAGVGVGMSIGPLAVHARFSQPDNRVAVVSGLTLFSRVLGGTVGLAQCGAVLNAKVRAHILEVVQSDIRNGFESDGLPVLIDGLTTGLRSLSKIDTLPGEAKHAVIEAFQVGTRFAFISIIPWAGLSVLLTLFLTNVRDTPRESSESLRQQQHPLATGSRSSEDDEKTPAQRRVQDTARV